MNAHQYRVTIEHLYTPHAADPLDPPLVFETSSQDALMLLFIVNRLRGQLEPEADCFMADLPRRRRAASTRPL
jgi:hypothetical protein